MGDNDKFGTCAFAMCGNHAVLLGKGVMGDGEILNAARVIEGLNDQDKSTDRGENVDALFAWIKANGWPGDPTFTISTWSPIPLANIGATITQRLAVPSWLMLPMTADESDYDFTDDALVRNAIGAYAHAVLIVEADSVSVTFITWAKPQTVSLRWARQYFRAFYDVLWIDDA